VRARVVGREGWWSGIRLQSRKGGEHLLGLMETAKKCCLIT
jgi:hypothetical protein